MVFAITIYILFTIRVNLKLLNRESDSKSRFLNLYIRILTDYFQILSTIFRTKIGFSFGLNQFFSQLSFITDILGNFFTFFYPLDCFYQTLPFNANVFYINLYVLFGLYPVIFSVNIIYWTISGFVRKIPYKIINYQWFTAIFLMSYMFQPSFINSLLKYINCIKIGNSTYIKSYLKEKCWVGSHLFHFLLIIMPSLLFWMFLYPLVVLFLMRRQIKQLNIINKTHKSAIKRMTSSLKIQSSFSFFTDGLKEEFYYWEIFLMFRKYGFIVFSVFSFGDDMNLNVFMMAILAFFTLLFQVQKNPFEFQVAINISLFANIIVLISVISILILLTNNSTPYQIFFVFLFGVLNTVLMCKWVYDVYVLKKHDLSLRISSLKNSLWSIFYLVGSKSPKTSKLKSKILTTKTRR